MRDKINTNDLGIRALTLGMRKVAKSSVRIAGDRFGGVCLAGWNGKWIYVACSDKYGLEYTAQDHRGTKIGTLKLLRGKSPTR